MEIQEAKTCIYEHLIHITGGTKNLYRKGGYSVHGAQVWLLISKGKILENINTHKEYILGTLKSTCEKQSLKHLEENTRECLYDLQVVNYSLTKIQRV